MGEIAEMMINGIMDANGEFTGINPGHLVYPKGWFGKGTQERNPEKGVRFFINNLGVPNSQQRSKKDQNKIIIRYGKEVLNIENSDITEICTVIQTNFGRFKGWYRKEYKS